MTTKRTVKTRVDGVQQTYHVGKTVQPREVATPQPAAIPAPLAPAPAPAPAPAETLRDGILRSWLANGQVESMDEAIEQFAGLVAEAGTAGVDEDEGEGGARLTRLAATYFMEWPALELNISSATPSQSALEYGVGVNEFMFAAATENVLTNEYNYPDAHETLLGNRTTLRRMFTQGIEPSEFAQWVTER